MARQWSTGNRQLDDALAEVIAALAKLTEGSRPGFFLHGSTVTETRGVSSDVDLLVLGSDDIERCESAAALVASDCSQRYALPFDVKVFSASAFASDPWVDVWRGATLVAGYDWRNELPDPSLDELAREAVLHACLIIGDGPGPLSTKGASWLLSALVAARHGYAPATRQDAARFAEQWEPKASALLHGATDGQLPTASGVALEAAVAAALRADLTASLPRLGARCHALIREYLAG